MKQQAEFDLVLYGATGFTGRLVAEYLVGRPSIGEVKWAMAGRNLEKLAGIRDEVGAPKQTPLVAADADDEASMTALARRAKAILTTVGPYQLYGGKLVAACAAEGTDYLDLCGEPTWMRQMIDAHSGATQQSGARIVFSCGFDSIPFDLGVLFLQDAAKARFGAPFRASRGACAS
jgi:short subunit dehydrogenase-like uncharacterized protein